MSRPGFVLEVDDKTPPLMTMSGSDLRLDRFGLGTRVVYGPDAETLWQAIEPKVRALEPALTTVTIRP